MANSLGRFFRPRAFFKLVGRILKSTYMSKVDLESDRFARRQDYIATSVVGICTAILLGNVPPSVLSRLVSRICTTISIVGKCTA